MNSEFDAVLAAVDEQLDTQATLLAEFLGTPGDNQENTYTALVVALSLLPPGDVIDLAFAGIVRAANVKLAEAENTAADV